MYFINSAYENILFVFAYILRRNSNINRSTENKRQMLPDVSNILMQQHGSRFVVYTAMRKCNFSTCLPMA